MRDREATIVSRSPRALAIAALIACAGCPSLVARSHRNAPGHLDLDTPPARPTADPLAYDAPIDPGEQRMMILPGAYWSPGVGRQGPTVAELGVQLRFTFAEQYGESSARDSFPLVTDAWSAAFGWAIVQTNMDDTRMSPTIGGPLYAEVGHHWYMIGAAAGVAAYPHQTEVGPQGTAWFGPFIVRARYMNDTGFEIFGGYQLELPTVWTWSR